MYKKIKYIFFILILILLIACDKGIEPKDENEQTGFGGTVTFIGEWPADIKRTFIVVFENPLLAPSDFTIDNLKFLSLEIPLGVQTYKFSSLDSSYIPQNPGPFLPGTYSYVAVAYQTTENLSLARRDWFVSGVYYANGDTTQPGEITINENVFLDNVNIVCDYDNPPPQPPGGI
jgi:hypothetical protein